MMKKIISQLVFTKQQQVGIILLLTLIIILFSVYLFYDPTPQTVLDISSNEVQMLQKQIDSLQENENRKKTQKIYPFNPNFLTEFKAYKLGMSIEEFDRLRAFRKKNKWINSKQDFKQITQVSDSLLDAISPYFKFPEWVTNPKLKYTYKNRKEKSFTQKIDLNKATQEDLQKIYGIGKTLSKRIVTYREKIGGFSDTIQLYQIYGLKDESITEILKNTAIKTPKPISKINLNTASASDIATIPGVSFELAKKIWEFRVLREQINTFSELKKIDGITLKKLQLIKLYLSLD